MATYLVKKKVVYSLLIEAQDADDAHQQAQAFDPEEWDVESAVLELEIVTEEG